MAVDVGLWAYTKPAVVVAAAAFLDAERLTWIASEPPRILTASPRRARRLESPHRAEVLATTARAGCPELTPRDWARGRVAWVARTVAWMCVADIDPVSGSTRASFCAKCPGKLSG